MRKTGSYIKLGNLDYFIPFSLPPKNPTIQLSSELLNLYGETMLQLGQFNEMATRLPDKQRFIKAYTIKEALLSSEIEGIHTTLIDIFTEQDLEYKPNKETQLVHNYGLALNSALEMLQDQNFPIATRLILKTHEVLMGTGHTTQANPGQYRQQGVRVGNLVPPPAQMIPELMSDLERYINTEDSLPPLIKAGLTHIQFETIHPFLDGNGRIGRLLIVLMLIDNKIIDLPILYPSYYFKKHHLEYYRSLDRVRTHGDFEGWIKFYLTAIKESSRDAWQRAKEIELLDKKIHQLVISDKKLLKNQETIFETITVLFQYPVISVPELAEKTQRSYNTTNSLINQLLNLGLISELTTQRRNKRYQFQSYLELLEKEINKESDIDEVD